SRRPLNSGFSAGDFGTPSLLTSLARSWGHLIPLLRSLLACPDAASHCMDPGSRRFAPAITGVRLIIVGNLSAFADIPPRGEPSRTSTQRLTALADQLGDRFESIRTRSPNEIEENRFCRGDDHACLAPQALR